MSPKRAVSLALPLILLLTQPSTTVAAEAYQSLTDITHTVEQFILSEYKLDAKSAVEIGRLDPRLRLKPCEQALQAFFPQASRKSKTTVGVRCTGPKTWTIYVSATISQVAKVLVARQHIPSGSLIKADDFEFKEYDINRLRYGYYTDLQAVLGKPLKRHLNHGAILTPSSIAVSKVIKRGESVSILAETGGISIRAKGQALEAGGIGDIIRVKNLKSKREIEARITGPGQVKVDL
ncbi:MAG: flagellar basal body P-ring formation chaperone FlgA [Gammaproteobacteria bacterium]|nr:flagellar basal body P-ring formation chaperone FlgA [Gammaproteobacteria bacterium]